VDSSLVRAAAVAQANTEGARDGEALLHLDMADRIAPQGIRNVVLPSPSRRDVVTRS
jgi:hypothetical protein